MKVATIVSNDMKFNTHGGNWSVCECYNKYNNIFLFLVVTVYYVDISFKVYFNKRMQEI